MKDFFWVVFTICFCASSFSSSAQDSTEEVTGGMNILANAHYGYVIPEYSSFTLLTVDPVHSLEFTAEKRLGNRNPWNQVFNHPTVGFTFFYTTLGNDEIHGSEYSLFPYVLLPIIERKKFKAGISLGLGLGYVTKTYDQETNPFNVVVGSHLNVHFQTKIDLRYALTEKIGVQTGLAFGHLSNANTAEPNIGINNGTVYLGLSYKLKNESIKVSEDAFELSREVFYEIALAPGFKSTRALRDSRHFTFSATGDIWKPVSPIVAFGIGPDVFYDGSAETELLSDPSTEYKPVMQWSTGIHGSFSLRYDRLRLILQAGVYLGLQNEVEDESIYNRAMVRYMVSDEFLVYFAMKSHLHILDHPEFGFGYRWGK
ncbi:MAG: acyloxyacyl hydrolase [Bacteroidota bacterium]